MNAHLMAKSAYSTEGQTALRTPRHIEYDLFARVTARLRSAVQAGAFPPLAAALHDNRRLWIALAADLAEDGNALPVPLRAQLISLAEFTRQHTSKVLQGAEQPDVLIEMNTAIMRGLRGDGATA